MRRYFSILKIFLKAKIVFKNPQKHELVIFDDESIKDLKNLLYHYNFFVLQTRIENINKIYFSFKILKYFLKNYNGNIMTAYLASLIEVVHPKVVLTFIDNSFKFFDVAKILEKKMHFVAIQNGARYDLMEHKHLYEKNILKDDFTKSFYIPNFLCFGQFEINYYKNLGIKVKNFFKVGSLRLANALHHIKKNKIKLRKFNYDICLLGEGMPDGNSMFDTPLDGEILAHEKGTVNMIKFTIKFCIKHNMKLIIAQKIPKEEKLDRHNKALNIYKKYLTDDEFNFYIANSIERTVGGHGSYIAMFQSNVSIGNYSTLLNENLAVGGKILSCNLFPTNIHDFPITGICSIKNCTFEEFEKRLLKIYTMSEKDYFSNLDKDKSYLVEYDEKVSTIEILKRKIDSFLANELSSKKHETDNKSFQNIKMEQN